MIKVTEAQSILLDAMIKIAKFKEQNGQHGKFYYTIEANIAQDALAKVGFKYNESMRTVTL